MVFCMNTDVLLHQTQNNTGLRSHTHKTDRSVLFRLQCLRKTDAKIVFSLCLYILVFFDASIQRDFPLFCFLFVFQRERPRKFRTGVYADRSDMTSFSILFPISPGT